jgi:Condensation domain
MSNETAGERPAELPLSFAQQRLWFLDQLVPGNPFYNVPAAYRVRGGLRVEVLREAVTALVGRHESLRTTFSSRDGRPFQVVGREAALDWEAARVGGPDAEARARELADGEAARPFDLAAGPLLRVRVLELGADDHVVVVVMHHIVSDGWSMGVLVRELAALYRARLAGREDDPLPPLAVQYADFALWQREWLSGEVLESQLAYWAGQLAGLPPALELPADRPRPAVPTYRGATHTFTVPAPVTAALRDLAQREGATLYMTLLAAFYVLVGRYTGESDVAVGTPIANRTRPELEHLIGFFVNTLVLRGDLSGDPTFRELLARTRDTALAAYAHQDLPFEQLVDHLQPERQLNRNPLTQILFALQNTAPADLALPGTEVNRFRAATGGAHLDLELHMHDVGDELLGQAIYAADLFDHETIERVMRTYVNVLGSIAAEHRDDAVRSEDW